MLELTNERQLLTQTCAKAAGNGHHCSREAQAQQHWHGPHEALQEAVLQGQVRVLDISRQQPDSLELGTALVLLCL